MSWSCQRLSRHTLGDDTRPLLDIASIDAGYGAKHVLREVSVDVDRGEIVAIIGHNGAGKSTLLKATMGLIPIRGGRIEFDGTRIDGAHPRNLLRRGIAYVPQGNRVFQALTVWENLQVAAMAVKSPIPASSRANSALQEFPILADRLQQRAESLSGGERQMLALGMALVLSPRCLLLDEPSLGLAPQVVVAALSRIQDLSREEGVAVMIVEQKVREALRIANRVVVLRNGTVTFFGPAAELVDDDRLRAVYI